MLDAQPLSIYNLKLEGLKCQSLSQDALERDYAKYLLDLSKREFHDLLMSEDNIEEVFQRYLDFIEDLLVHKAEAGVIYVQTSKMLKFYKSHFKKRLQDVLIIQDQDTKLAEIAQSLREQHKINELPVILTDVKDAPALFNLLCNTSKCARLIRYGKLYNSKTKEIIDIN